MELILDDDDHMQFYPALGDVEAAVLHVVSAVSGTMQNVPTVQVQPIIQTQPIDHPMFFSQSEDKFRTKESAFLIQGPITRRVELRAQTSQ